MYFWTITFTSVSSSFCFDHFDYATAIKDSRGFAVCGVCLLKDEFHQNSILPTSRFLADLLSIRVYLLPFYQAIYRSSFLFHFRSTNRNCWDDDTRPCCVLQSPQSDSSSSSRSAESPMSVQVDPMAASMVAAALSGTYPTLLPQWCLPPREAPLVGVQTHQDNATAVDQPLDLSAKPRNTQVRFWRCSHSSRIHMYLLFSFLLLFSPFFSLSFLFGVFIICLFRFCFSNSLHLTSHFPSFRANS